MLNRVKRMTTKSKSFGILIFCVLVAVVVIATSIGITSAWFTSRDAMKKDSTVPTLSVDLIDGDGNDLAQEFALDPESPDMKVKVKVETNIDAYLRYSIVPLCYNGNDIESDLNGFTYYTVTQSASWFETTNYTGTFTYNSTNYNNASLSSLYKYYGTATNPTVVSTHTSGTATETSYEIVSSIARTAEEIPEGITVKLQVLVEAVQGNTYGLSYWIVS